MRHHHPQQEKQPCGPKRVVETGADIDTPGRTERNAHRVSTLITTTLFLSLAVLTSPLPSSFIASASVGGTELQQKQRQRLTDSDAFQRIALLQQIRQQQQRQSQQSPPPLPELAESQEFQRLRREGPQSRALRELRDLKNLEDDRLELCAEKGVFWEQCFMFGDGGTSGTMTEDPNTGRVDNSRDYQLLSPTGALEPGGGSGVRNKIPTW